MNGTREPRGRTAKISSQAATHTGVIGNEVE